MLALEVLRLCLVVGALCQVETDGFFETTNRLFRHGNAVADLFCVVLVSFCLRFRFSGSRPPGPIGVRRGAGSSSSGGHRDVHSSWRLAPFAASQCACSFACFLCVVLPEQDKSPSIWLTALMTNIRCSEEYHLERSNRRLSIQELIDLSKQYAQRIGPFVAVPKRRSVTPPTGYAAGSHYRGPRTAPGTPGATPRGNSTPVPSGASAGPPPSGLPSGVPAVPLSEAVAEPRASPAVAGRRARRSLTFRGVNRTRTVPKKVCRAEGCACCVTFRQMHFSPDGGAFPDRVSSRARCASEQVPDCC